MKRNGFTLIELLVVIFIIGILAGVLFPNFVGSRQRARDSRRKHDLAEIKTALRLYYNDHQSYPPSVPFGSSWGDYMQTVPQDPTYDPDSGTGGYNYCVSDDGEGFVLCAQLENKADSSITQSQARCNPDPEDPIICDCGCEGSSCYYVCED